MSIYQSQYFIVPRKGNYSLFEGLNLNSFLEDGLFEDDLFWNGTSMDFQKISAHLQQNLDQDKSWSENLKIYGNNELNHINLFFKEDTIQSMSFRVNFTTDYSTFLNTVIELCKLNDLLIVDNDLNVLSLDYQTLIDNLSNSKTVESFKKFDEKMKSSEKLQIKKKKKWLDSFLDFIYEIISR